MHVVTITTKRTDDKIGPIFSEFQFKRIYQAKQFLEHSVEIHGLLKLEIKIDRSTEEED